MNTITAREMGERAHERLLASHTYAKRAEQTDALLHLLAANPE